MGILPPRRNRQGTARALAASGALLIAASLLFTSLTLNDRRVRTLEAKQKEIDNLSLLLSSETERIFEAGELVIRATMDEVRKQPPLGGMLPKEASEVLRARISGIPPIRNVTIIDRDGNIRASSAPGIAGSIGKTEAFHFMRDTATDGNYVFRLTNHPGAGVIIPVLRRLTDASGRFAGLIVLSLEPQYFQTLFSAIHLDPGEELRVARSDGSVFASIPDSLTPAAYTTGTVFVTPLRDHVPVTRAERGTVHPADGAYQVARAHLTRFPLYVEIRADKNETLASWRLQALVIALFVLGFCGFAAFLVLRMYNEMGRRLAAERNAETQARLFQDVFDTVPHPVFVKDTDDRYVTVNRAMADYWRTTPEALVGKHIAGREGRAADEINAVLAEDQAVLVHGRETTAVRETTFPDGRTGVFHVVRRPLRDAEGRITGLVGTAVDMTHQLRAEAEVRSSQRLLRSIFDTLPHNLWVKDAQGNIVMANRALERASRETVEQMRGKPVPAMERRKPEEVQRVIEEDQRVLKEGVTLNVERWITSLEDQPMRLHLIKVPLRDESGAVVGVIGASLNTTATAQAEAALRDSQALLQTVFDTLPQYVWVKDKERRTVMVNKAVTDYAGRPTEQVLGQTVVGADFRPATEVEEISDEDRRVIEHGETVDVQRWNVQANGERRMIHFLKRPLRNGRGEVTGLVGIAIDLTDHVRAEQKARESEERLATIINTIPHHIWMKDRAGKLVLANTALERYVGKATEALKGTRIVGSDYRPAEENARIAAEDRRVLEGGESLEEVQWATAPDGSRRRFHLVKHPLRDASGAVTGLAAISIDITALTRAEEALRQSQALLQAVFDAVPLAVLVWNREGKLIASNRAAAALWERPVEAMKGLTLADLVPVTGELAAANALDTQVMREDRIVDYEHDLTLGGGKTVRVRAIKAPLHDTEGAVSGLLTICEDVTEEAEAAEALRSSQALLKTIFDAIPMAMLVKDLNDTLIMANPPMTRRWGMTPDEMIGRNLKAMDIPASERKRVEDTDQLAVYENRILDYEIERTMPDGKKRLLRAIKAPLHDKEGRVTAILGMSEDITERRRVQEEKGNLQRQLEQVQKMDTVGRLAGGVAHDFNNLLTPVIGFVDLAMMRAKDDERLRGELKMIREAATRAAELTRGLLSFSRSQVMTLRPVNLNDEVQSLNRMVSRVIGESVEIVLNLDPGIDLVQADATQMHQVLMNLAVNARDAMPHGGKLVIETQNIKLDSGYAERILETAPGDYVMVSVSDTGVGMDAETQTRIFEPFFTTKEVGKGTGLGLSIVYGIVRQHQGTIRVYSEVGQGTSFKILLPRHAPGAALNVSTHRSPEQLRGTERVLVVEDEARVRDAVCALLSSLGYEVLQAGSPEEALVLAGGNRNGRIQLLISDMMMPGKNGRELFAALRKQDPRLNVLFMSGYPRHVLSEMAAAVGPDRFLSKPFGLQDLAEKVRTIIELGAPA